MDPSSGAYRSFLETGHMLTNRRHFMRLLASTGAGLAGSSLLAACAGNGGSTDASEAAGSVDGGNVADLELNSPRTLSQPVVVIRDDGGVYAMTTICTHQQCDMSRSGSITSTGLACRCHGSRFDLDGNVTVGPANRPLDHFAVTVDDQGNITVHCSAII